MENKKVSAPNQLHCVVSSLSEQPAEVTQALLLRHAQIAVCTDRLNPEVFFI